MASIPFVIAASETESNAVNIGSNKVRGIIIPPGWTAAPLSVLASRDNIAFYSLYRRGNEWVEPVTANTWPKLDHEDFSAAVWIKFQSGSVTSGLVPQVADVTLLLVAD